jgi:hypothetical protein
LLASTPRAASPRVPIRAEQDEPIGWNGAAICFEKPRLAAFEATVAGGVPGVLTNQQNR